MGKFGTFLLGLVLGAATCFLVLYLINHSKVSGPEDPHNFGVEMFDEPGDVIPVKALTVLQAQAAGSALAMDTHGNTMMIVLLWNDDKIPYYDMQEVKLKAGECFRQVGLYRYMTKEEVFKTVPVVVVEKK